MTDISILHIVSSPWLLIMGSFGVFAIAAVLGTLLVVGARSAERENRLKNALMPTMQELGAADATLNEVRESISHERDRLREIVQQQASAERDKADAQHWRALAEETKRDYEGLEDKRKQVDAVRDEFEDAAKDLAARRSEIDANCEERDRLADRIDNLTKQLEDLKIREAEVEALDKKIADSESRLGELRTEIADARDEREAVLQARFEVDQLQRKKTELEEALAQLPDDLEDLSARKIEIEEEIAELRSEQAQLRGLRDEVDRLTANKLGLEASIEALNRTRDNLNSDGESPDDPQAALVERTGDLRRPPSCLFAEGEPVLLNPIEDTSEENLLDQVREHLADLNLQFEDRIIKRFHTCLKTSRISPLTVLAGISGTGKSQLPQRYAEAMGINFLKLPVQPRWDSPQDLLGFYNYLERKYKATDLARALVRMDEHSDVFGDEETASNRVLLVLLDEMNLSRVEYYFSEFLSRLEGRPDPETTDEARLRPGRIEIDIPIKGAQFPGIYPGHNVLFAGTMNEDESTQALSDKVLDRANMIRFQKPDTLESQVSNDGGIHSEEYLPYDTWLGWYRQSSDLDENTRRFILDFVSDINNHLGDAGRPFGHRVTQAIFAYVANHPDGGTEEGMRGALADMLEMRILPKLRGVELEGSVRGEFQQIGNLVEQRLNDDHLANRIDRAARENDVFTWTGA